MKLEMEQIMNTGLKIVTLATLGALTLGATAFAEGGKRGGKLDFSTVDTNEDGFITVEELQAHQVARFAERDANGDGFLNADEMKAAWVARAEEKGREINEERLERRVEFMLRGLDENNDNQVSAEEAQKGDPAQMIERLDTDGDGKISVAELEEIRGKKSKKREG